MSTPLRRSNPACPVQAATATAKSLTFPAGAYIPPGARGRSASLAYSQEEDVRKVPVVNHRQRGKTMQVSPDAGTGVVALSPGIGAAYDEWNDSARKKCEDSSLRFVRGGSSLAMFVLLAYS